MEAHHEPKINWYPTNKQGDLNVVNEEVDRGRVLRIIDFTAHHLPIVVLRRLIFCAVVVLDDETTG